MDEQLGLEPDSPPATPAGLLSEVLWLAALTLLVIGAAISGMVLAIGWDAFRTILIDPDLAQDVGYGEITENTPAGPRGIGLETTLNLLFIGGTATTVGLMWVAHQRRLRSDRAPRLLPWGIALFAATPGCVWIAGDWVEIPDATGTFRVVLAISGVGLPMTFAALGTFALWRWNHHRNR
jgi:hypothetical protein